MAKFVLMSMLIATVAIPMRAARDPLPGRALGRTVVWFSAFTVVYVIAIVYVLPRFS